jgi:N-acyl-D-aspartate/D-glutamate deacylase
MQDEAYRRRFRRDYEVKLSPRVWNRDFYQAEIVGCPDASVVGQTFGQVADARGLHPVDAFLDLMVAARRAAALAHDHRQPPATTRWTA